MDASKYNYVLGLIEEIHGGNVSPWNVIAILETEGIKDLTEDNKLLRRIIESFDEDYDGVNYTFSIFIEKGDVIEELCGECKVLDSYELQEEMNDARDSAMDDVMYDIPAYARPYFDAREYAEDLIANIYDLYPEDSYDTYECVLPLTGSTMTFYVIYEKEW